MIIKPSDIIKSDLDNLIELNKLPNATVIKPLVVGIQYASNIPPRYPVVLHTGGL